MEEVKHHFVDALMAYVRAALQESGEAADYSRMAVRIVDARNLLFCSAGACATDETEDVFALRDLCCIDEDTLEFVPDRGRIESVARNYF